MDQHSTQEAKHHTNTKQPQTQNLPILNLTRKRSHQTSPQDVTPKPITDDRHEALLQMKKMDPFCKHISKWLSNGMAPQHEANLLTHIKGLLYKHVMDANQKFMALIPKAWKYTVLVEAHDKLGHQGVTHTYCIIKQQYYWKGMNKDIWKYIANCTLCHREKAKV